MKALTEAQAKEMRALTRTAGIRAERKQFLIEGPHLLDSALDHAPQLFVQVAMTAHAAERYSHLLDRCVSRNIPCYSISEKLAQRASDTEESQGIFAMLRMPEPETDAVGDIAIALDGVQDPGNVGTIIRTAAWFGVKSVLLGQGTADPYAPKVVRATQGAIFSVGLEPGLDLARRIARLRTSGWRVLATTLSKNAQSLYCTTFDSKTILILGSEAHGIQPGLMTLVDGELVIPQIGEGDSLNVAISAAIILGEARRQQAATQ
jgi:RNA methyltransferase, TrmH family